MNAMLTRRRDWFRILRDLIDVDISMSAVARKCNRHVTTVQNWAEGSEPKESDARVVLALYARYCPEKYAEHQRGFEIRIEIDRTTDAGENFALPFAGSTR